ncbi:MAG: hypothetical protein ACKVT1_15520 [Dehalococcoidia bacterium]
MPDTPRGRLINAWTRVAELRLPRTIAPQIVLNEVERLVNLWDARRGEGGINPAAFLLSRAPRAQDHYVP